jgi:hypothetical protein
VDQHDPGQYDRAGNADGMGLLGTI